MRGLLVALAVVALLVVLADAAGTVLLERAIAQRASDALDAPADAEVSGWPVTLRALTDSVPTISVTATDVPLTQVSARMSRLEATLADVDLRAAGDAAETGQLPPASSGRWSAGLDEADLQAAVPEVAGVRLLEGTVEITVSDVVIEAAVTAEDGRLVVRPSAALLGWAQVAVGFDELPGAPTVERVTVTPSAITVEGVLHPPPPR